MSVIELCGVTKTFADTNALSAIDLTVHDGEFLVLLGPSGCGKSTLLRILAGLEVPTTGSVRIDGTDVTTTPPRERDIAMVFQSYALYPHLSVAKNIGFPLRTAGLPRKTVADTVAHVAELLDLTPLLRRRPGQLSGGQRQRVALARAMVREPGTFLMDEPLSNLDARLRAVTRTELIALHARLHKTFLYVTHDQVEAMTMADRIALLDKGRIEQVGTPTELYDAPRTVFVAGFLGSPPMNLVDVRLRCVDGELRADLVDQTLSLGISTTTDDLDRTRVTLGIRPERLAIARREHTAQDRNRTLGERPTAADSPRAAATITATVGLIENLGADILAHCRVGEVSLCARLPRVGSGHDLRPGTPIVLVAEHDDLHFFDAETGRRLHWVGQTDRAGTDPSSRSSSDTSELTRVGAPQ
ncbi:ABC transporter ATP-binding protein [Gordonia soli]|uniref:Trehalose import ATP-binding protein SugC n=1 Tax=Gordonia soli NBRC 108243 TaxID=1223545 RepID=M0QJD1_9ACTN|nr:ABC transporter ATP-binding protein [Gordonia soli]GAC68673.1 putative ABC transporter ATP-binding protein [Gordonia soli NBRC 108243]